MVVIREHHIRFMKSATIASCAQRPLIVVRRSIDACAANARELDSKLVEFFYLLLRHFLVFHGEFSS
jgi:hypothetical protein